ncbi:polyprenyl synthetase family protein [Halalkalibacterium ligniniphilum]|uniref:polyprenyl synthetase family protein n=1 Tax=Halalkalibacterium ligniniphilum TaxID=1134413 RepID=UPI000347D75A|nr:farnesyl diphosphate synthase [Halalkalibacterium ligniniphilum]
MNEWLHSFMLEKKQWVDEVLPSHIAKLQAPDTLKEAMIYSLNAGGKRIRPALLLATIESFGQDVRRGIDLACAIEMIHTYSLIHDDLPSMDNDDLRRGKPTNHKVYGVANAILAGDALLTYSFELVAKMDVDSLSAEQKLKLIEGLAKAAGPEGMVGGQVADIEGENKRLSVEELEYIHHHKTGDLLAFSVVAGAILSGAEKEEIRSLHSFAKELGLLFQIKDDILDVEGDAEVIGKPIGSDTENNKSTYPSILTLEGAKEKLLVHTKRAKEYLFSVKMNHTLLEGLTDYVINRDH